MYKIFKRGLRQGKFNGFDFLKSYKRSQLPELDRVAIRRNVQNMHDCEEVEEVNWGVGSKFQMDVFTINHGHEVGKSKLLAKEKKNTAISQPSDTNFETIIQFLKEVLRDNVAIEKNIKFYTASDKNDDNHTQASHIVLDLESVHSRRSLLQTILSAFKPIFPKRYIPVDGDTGKSIDWIVIDLKSTYIHIFDPKIRQEVNLDQKLESEFINCTPTDLLDKEYYSKVFMENFKSSIPKSMASRSNLIDKFKNRKLSDSISD